MKICSVCKIEKPYEDYYNTYKHGDGYNPRCKSCASDYNRKHNAKFPEKNRARRAKSRELLRKQYLEYLNNSTCADCGSDNILTLEFDHLDSEDKSECVSIMLKNCRSWKIIKEEMDKCDVVCRNCHVIRTRIANNDFRYQFLLERENSLTA